jgi:hypothetical protein
VVLMRHWLLFVTLTACGRIGIDERQLRMDAPTSDATDDAPMLDAPDDAKPDMMIALACPADMARLSPTSDTCIELADRVPEIWLDGKAICTNLGRRYCTDAEWFEACENATGLVGMVGDYEWVAEESGGIAQKRGSSSCDDPSSHVITDPYPFRCCGPMI